MQKEQYQQEISSQTPKRLKIKGRYIKEQIMQQMAYLNYPSYNHYCFGCNEEIKTEKSKNCKQCSKTAHLPCVLQFSLFTNENTREPICKYCHSIQFCWSCNRSIFQFERKIKCSVCYRFMHIQCWKMPLQLFQISNEYLDRIYHKFSNSYRTVCLQCQKRWKLAEISFMINIDGKSYYLTRIKHQSPLHYVWKYMKDVEELLKKMGEEDIILLQSKYIIQNIFSMELPQKFRHFTLNDLVYFLQNENNLHSNDQSRIKFLVKWRNTQFLLWQDLDIFQYRDQSIQNFLRHFQINFVKCNPRDQISRSVPSIIDYYLINYKCLDKVNYIKSAKDSSVAHIDQNDQIMKKINDMFISGKKFSLKTNGKSQKQKITALTNLINTIYFIHKIVSPILLFTERAKTKWWSLKFNELNPYHIVFILGGSQDYLTSIIQQYLYIEKKGQLLLRHNIIILEYQSLYAIQKQFPLKSMIDNSALMIMDQKMNPIGRIQYENASISKIKLCHKYEQESSNISVKNTSSSSTPSLQEIVQNSQIEKVNAIDNRRGEEEQHDYTKSNQILYENWSKIKNNFEINRQIGQSLLNDLQRLVILRYIMAFGFHFVDQMKYYKGIINFDRFIFDDQNSESQIDKIKRYMTEFISVVWVGQLRSYPIQKQILKYYFFDIDLKEIFMRSIIIKQLNKYYNYAKSRHVQFTLQLLMIQGVINHGFGRWQTIGLSSRVWCPGGQKMSFYQFFKIKAERNIKLLSFYRCLRNTMITVIKKMKKAGFI